MRRRLALLLLMKLSGLLPHSAKAQSQLSLEHYYTMGAGSSLTVTPVASYQAGKGFYSEGRYNYEAPNTFSLYMGRTYSKEAKLSYSISPIAGAVIGELNGGSLGANISVGYKNFYLYTQPQYTFSVEGAYDNYIYSWTDITYSPLNWLSVGVSLQHTKGYKTKGFVENGLVIEAAYKKLTFPIYIYSPHTSSRTFLFGASIELNFKRNKSSDKRNSDSFKEVYPINIIAKTAEKVNDPVKEEEKPANEPVVKVRRVNVLVHTKTENQLIGDSRPINFTENNKGAIEKKNAVSTAVLKQAQAPQPVKPAINSNPVIKKETGRPTPALGRPIESKQPEEFAQENKSEVYFALLLGPLNSESEALNLKSKLTQLFSREIALFTEEQKYKLRIAGFEDKKAAEIFSLNAKNEGCVTASVIIPYKLKTIDAIPLKIAPKLFEATKLY
ncbi:MAG: SPOR domain-containing protein [Sphingobacteriaceae bacterium]|nr:SPOR domain-containing protein [Sphingobacteriaceae bacterium]